MLADVASAPSTPTISRATLARAAGDARDERRSARRAARSSLRVSRGTRASSGRSTIGASTPSTSRKSAARAGSAASAASASTAPYVWRSRWGSGTLPRCVSRRGLDPAGRRADRLDRRAAAEREPGDRRARVEPAPDSRVPDVRVHPRRRPARPAARRQRRAGVRRHRDLDRGAAPRGAARTAVVAELRAVAEEIAADPRYADGEPIGPDDEPARAFPRVRASSSASRGLSASA